MNDKVLVITPREDAPLFEKIIEVSAAERLLYYLAQGCTQDEAVEKASADLIAWFKAEPS